MRFSNCLQGRASHDALLQVQDAELVLLETIKKSLLARIKCDRDYAQTLSTVCLQAQKCELQDLSGSFTSHAWKVIMEETELFGKMIKHNADYLSTYTLEMVNWLMMEKRASRKVYIEERNKIELELLVLQDSVLKIKSDYHKQLPICQLAKQKFEESYLKGKGGRKFEEIKEKYVKACKKLHRLHNDYVLILNEALQYERDYRVSILPGLLEFQQTVQEDMTQQCKLLLKDYIQHTDFANESFQQMHTRMATNVEGIIISEEYREFIEKNKTPPLLPVAFVFDHELIEDYNGKLRPNVLAVDDLTFDTLKERMFELEERLKDCHCILQEKLSVLTHFEKEVETLQCNKDSSASTYVVKKRAADILKKEVNELKCQEEKLKYLVHFIKTSLSGCEKNGPPHAVDLPSDVENVLVCNYEDHSDFLKDSLFILSANC